MEKESFSRLLRKKSNEALLELLDLGQSDNINIDSSSLDLIIKELKSRGLSEEDMRIKISEINFYEKPFSLSNQEGIGAFSKEEMLKILGSVVYKGRESRNVSLRNTSEQISLYANFLLIFAIGYFVYFSFFSGIRYGFIYGIIVFFGFYISRLFIVAFSKLILVLLDIESNTRKES